MKLLKKALGRLALRLLGWRLAGKVPAHPRFVMIAAPHTSNWDAVFLVAMSLAYGLRLHWMVKKSACRGALGWLVRCLGGVPIDRSATHDTVAQMTAWFQSEERLALAISPQGTRRRVEYWKSGFYRIAMAAGLPVALGFLDYEHKVGGFGPTLVLTGNVRVDMDRMREFYRPFRGRYPEQVTEPRLKEEAVAVDQAEQKAL